MGYTPKQIAMEPQNWCFGSMFIPFPRRHFQVPAVSFHEHTYILAVTDCYDNSRQLLDPTKRQAFGENLVLMEKNPANHLGCTDPCK